jgi:hypothetical protein
MADVNGTWLGTYWQSENPTRFEAALVQSGNALTGNILDDSFLGEAQVSGEVIGRSISFSKRYLTTSSAPVDYTGTISEDENFIQGKWKIGRRYSGVWEARRGGDNLTADLENAKRKQLPVTV